MRLRGISEESGEAIPKLKEVIQSIAGVNIMKDKDTFKSTYDILVDISKVWDGITDKDRANLSEQIAGKHQANVFASIMSNMQDGISATEVAMNSFGSAALEQEKYMESINAKINTFKETTAMFWNNLIESDSIKIIVDLGISVVRVLDKIFNSSKKVNLGYSLMISSALWLNKSYREMIKGLLHYDTTMKKIVIETKKGKIAISDLGTSIQTTSIKGLGFTGVLGLLKLKMKELAHSTLITELRVKALQITMSVGLSVVLSTVISALARFIEKILGSKKAVEELISTFKDNVQQNNSNIQSLSQIADEYENLSNKTNLSVKEQERLIELNNSIADMLPETLVGYDKQGNAIISLTGNLRDYIKELEKKNTLEARQFLAEGFSNKSFKNAFDDMKDYQDEVDRINREIDMNNRGMVVTPRLGLKSFSEDITTLKRKQLELPAGSKELKKVEENIKKIEDFNKKKEDELAKAKSKYPGMEEVVQSLRQALIMANDDFKELDDNSQIFLKKYINELDFSDFKKPEELRDYINGLIEAISEDPQSIGIISQIEDLNKEAKSGNVKNYEEEINELINNLGEIQNLDSKILSRIFKIDVKDVKEVNKAFQEMLEKIEQADEKWTNSIENMNFYNKVMKELDENGELSSATRLEIIEKHSELIPLLSDEAELYNIVAKSRAEEETAAKDATIEKLKNSKSFLSNILKNNKSLNDELKALYGEDLANYTTVLDAKRRGNDLLTNIYGDQWFTRFNTDTDGLETFVAEWERLQSDIRNGRQSDLENNPIYSEENYRKAIIQLKVEEDYKKELDAVRKTLDDVNLSQEENTKKVDKNKEVIDAIKRSLKDLEIQLKNVDYLLHKQENRMKNMVKGSQEYRDALKEENRLLAEKIKLFDKEIEVSENGAATLGNIIATNGGESLGTQLVTTAKEYLGTPYVWGGEDTSGFD